MSNCSLFSLIVNLPGHAPIIKPLLSREDDPQSPAEILRVEAHDLQRERGRSFHRSDSPEVTDSDFNNESNLLERVFKQSLTGDRDLNVLRHCQLLHKTNKQHCFLEKLSKEIKMKIKDIDNNKTHLTPESEVLNFGFEVSNVCDLRTVLSETQQNKSFITKPESNPSNKLLIQFHNQSFKISPSNVKHFRSTRWFLIMQHFRTQKKIF